MANKPNFTRSQVPAPPPGAKLPDTGGLPLKTGEAVMTDWTKKQLQALGWREGDPVPGDMGKRIQQAIAEMRADNPSTPVPDAKPGDRVKIGKQVNLADLPPEKQAELAQALREAAELRKAEQAAAAARIDAEAQLPADMHPSVRAAALQGIQHAQAQAALSQRPEVVIDGPETPNFTSRATPRQAAPAAPAAPAASPQPAQVVSLSSMPDEPDEPDAPEAAAAPAAQPSAAPAANAGGALPLTRCPRCMWALDQPFQAEPTEADRNAFVACILGAERFYKEYELMGGRLRVRFRSLVSKETDLVFQQMRIDGVKGAILGDGDYFGRLNAYRMALMVDSIHDGDNCLVAQVPPVFDIPYDGPEGGMQESTRMEPMLEWFNSHVVKSESLRRVVAAKHREFQRLLESLEAQTSNANFW